MVLNVKVCYLSHYFGTDVEFFEFIDNAFTAVDESDADYLRRSTRLHRPIPDLPFLFVEQRTHIFLCLLPTKQE